MFNRELSLFLLAVDTRPQNSDIPLIGLLVEACSLGIQSRFRPDVDFEYIYVRFEEVGEFTGRSEDGPVGWEGVERKVVGVRRKVEEVVGLLIKNWIQLR